MTIAIQFISAELSVLLKQSLLMTYPASISKWWIFTSSYHDVLDTRSNILSEILDSMLSSKELNRVSPS